MEQLRGARRINVTGNVAVGKSTLARQLGELLDRPVIHLDELIWDPGWRKVDEPTRTAAIASAAAGDAWIIDGVSQAVRRRADAIVFLDLPRRTAIWRALRRAASLRMRHRPELGPGYPELRAIVPALRLAMRFDARVRDGIVADLAGSAEVIHVTSLAQLEQLSPHRARRPRRR